MGTNLNIRPDEDPASLKEHLENNTLGRLTKVSRVAGVTHDGRSITAVEVTLPDGKIAVGYTTTVLFLGAATILRGKEEEDATPVQEDTGKPH